ncbi:hypothetical protein ABZ348_34115 [Streptomyces sp. NPDC005963]|uniref:hypothetical protein n=1 Tax=Streptomyces sp. NPDC005963 TaxID=3156721 RepID=UPI0033C2EB2A
MDRPTVTAPPHQLDGTTGPEHEALPRFEHRQSNNETAAEPLIGRTTVKAHVTPLLYKLGAYGTVSSS